MNTRAPKHTFMSPPFWKKYLSYLFELHIESAPSEHNPHLYVSLSKGRYQLCTANAIYSFEDLYDNFALTFQQMDWQKINAESVLILGFGLGSIPLLLEKKFQQQFHYTAVEIDESVLYLANKYLMSNLTSSVEFICTDANIFVRQCQERFDIIAVDIFLDDIIPANFQQKEFLDTLENLLHPNGVLLYNRLANTEADRVASQRYFSDIFEPQFPKGKYLEVNGNWMLINRKDMLKE